MEVSALNESALTPLDVSTPSPRGAQDREIGEILTQARVVRRGGRSNSLTSTPVANAPQSSLSSTSRKLNHGAESLDEIRNAQLVVVALIVIATYQSVLQPPKFIKVVNDKNSKEVEQNKYNYNVTRITLSYVTPQSNVELVVSSLFLCGNTFGFFLSIQMIICLTKYLPVRLPLMLSLITMVVTYFTFTTSLLLTSHLHAGPLTLLVSAVLLLKQRPLAVVMNLFLGRLFRLHLLADMCKLENKDSENEDSEDKDLENKDKSRGCKL
ncbi:uncharacterized protein LOC120293815 [Eucalyptus grandis]|uniref:uncharacterized protein LOC120293815 n=1 Tax=Eucalyptus grandis TaxID=71139 RepID=UPI00192F0E1F|nr:uncharacterized protein LOC120293815 [Eucalyptus grandis]